MHWIVDCASPQSGEALDCRALACGALDCGGAQCIVDKFAVEKHWIVEQH